MANEDRPPVVTRVVGVIPLIAIMSAFGFLSSVRIDTAMWERHRDFWHGNPAEVYSHWLDMVLMSGNAAAIAWFVGAEAFFRRRVTDANPMRRFLRRCAVTTIVLSGIAAIRLDAIHGEGTVMLALPIDFIPILASSFYLLRKIAARLQWKFNAVIALCVAFTILHTVAQLFYEPSGTGAPNGLIFPVWLGMVGLTGAVALVHGVNTGRVQRFFQRTIRISRNPNVWGTALIVTIAVGVPITIHSHRLHKSREQLALPWLQELENKLSDATVAELRQVAASVSANHEKIPIPAAAKEFMEDPRTRTNNSLRIYIPMNQADYLFLWANSRFQYCDTRKLGRSHSVQIDQDFIDDLMATGATHQTGLYSILWSSYMAGTVLKDAAGAVKAVCVIKTAER